MGEDVLKEGVFELKARVRAGDKGRGWLLK
jgi:hypothetical protein